VDPNPLNAEAASGARVGAPTGEPALDPNSYGVHDGRVEPPGRFSTVWGDCSGSGLPGAGFRIANTKKIYLLRGSKKLKFNYKEVIKGRNMGQNILFENRDQIIVA
jgi:hypothetical protein